MVHPHQVRSRQQASSLEVRVPLIIIHWSSGPNVNPAHLEVAWREGSMLRLRSSTHVSKELLFTAPQVGISPLPLDAWFRGPPPPPPS